MCGPRKRTAVEDASDDSDWDPAIDVSDLEQFVEVPTEEQVARIKAHNRKKAKCNSADDSAGSKKKLTATQKAVTNAHGKAKNAKKSPPQQDGVKPRASKGNKDMSAAATAGQARMMLDVQKERNKGLARTMKAAARIKGEAIKDAVAAQSKVKFRLHRTQALDAKVDKMANRLVQEHIARESAEAGRDVLWRASAVGIDDDDDEDDFAP